MLPRPIAVAGRKIGFEQPCFVIAEAGVNHNGDIALARKLIYAAADAGADAVKFQTFKADRLTTASAPKAEYQTRLTDAAESQQEMLRKLELSENSHVELLKHAQRRGILFLSTPFDECSAEFLNKLGIPLFKIPSGEITNLPFLEQIARMKKPIILSTGMANMDEVEAAVKAIQRAENDEIILLQCVTNYPAAPADTNLRAMRTMSERLHVATGYSDHTLGIEVSLSAVALGACVIEKHLTLDKNLPGPDHRASSEPEEFAALVRGIRKVEEALGTGHKEPARSENASAAVIRKSLVAACDVARGEVLTAEMISAKRPGTGLSPALRDKLIGRKVRNEISAGTLLTLEMLE